MIRHHGSIGAELQERRLGLTTGWSPGMRRTPVGVWHNSCNPGTVTESLAAPRLRTSKASYLMPVLRQNSGCARFHRSCSGLVTLARWVAADEHGSYSGSVKPLAK